MLSNKFELLGTDSDESDGGEENVSFLKSWFQWVKMLKKTSVQKMDEIPFASAPINVYKTTLDMLRHCPDEAVESFVLRTLQIFHSDLSLNAADEQEHESSRSRDDIFLALAMIIRCKPDVLIRVWPRLKENTKCRVQVEILALAWVVVSQVCLRDYHSGLFLWVRYLFPLVISSKSNLSQSSTDMIFEIIRRIQEPPRHGYDNGVRNGERVVPSSTLELCARAAFSKNNSISRKVQKLLRREYDSLRYIAFEAETRKVCEELVPFAIKAAGEGEARLARKAWDIFLWCLIANDHGCFKSWENLGQENPSGSVFMLKKLSARWNKLLYRNPSLLGPLMRTMKAIVMQSEKALASEQNATREAGLKEALELAKGILGPELNSLISLPEPEPETSELEPEPMMGIKTYVL